jgi:DNA repair protein RecO
MKSSNKKGIIYRIYSSGQSDKIINVIDQDGSKNTLLAKGAKKSTSRKSHSIELCNSVELKTIEGYQLPLITEIKVINEFIDWKRDNAGMLLIQLFCEVIDKLCYENNHDKNLHTIFSQALNNYSTNNLLIANAFLLKAIWHTGSINSITANALTGEPLNSENIYYSNQIAGYISKEDLAKNIELFGEAIPAKIAKSQKFIIENPLPHSLKLEIPHTDLMKMLQIALDWFEIITEQRLKSKGIILSLVGKLNK